MSTTEYYQGIATGGLQEKFRFGGRNDYLINVDGEKAGLWQGLYINLHGETVFGESVNLMTGAVVPVNIGRAHPVLIGTETALTAVKFTQALSENFVVFGGKINTFDNVQQPFMQGRGSLIPTAAPITQDGCPFDLIASTQRLISSSNPRRFANFVSASVARLLFQEHSVRVRRRRPHLARPAAVLLPQADSANVVEKTSGSEADQQSG